MKRLMHLPQQHGPDAHAESGGSERASYGGFPEVGVFAVPKGGHCVRYIHIREGRLPCLPHDLICSGPPLQTRRLRDHVPRWLRLGWTCGFLGRHCARGCEPGRGRLDKEL